MSTKLLRSCAETPDHITTLLTAPTGTSAFNIDANTIHSAFHITAKFLNDKYTPLREEHVSKMRTTLGSVLILIIDEISMVGLKLMTYIHGRLQQIKRDENGFFGSICVLAFGDFCQLPPVKQKRLLGTYPETWNPWDHFKKVELTEIMRQKNDLIYAQFLNRIRTYRPKQQIPVEDNNFLKEISKKQAPDNVTRTFALKVDVNRYNSARLKTIAEQDKCKIHEILAIDSHKDKTTKSWTRAIGLSKVTNSLDNIIELCIGAKVLLIKNIAVADGLVNGVFGNVTHIEFSSNDTNMPIAVWVTFDSEKVGKKTRSSYPSSLFPNATKIEPYDDEVGVNLIRQQIPLILAYACTIHKLQGSTFKELVVSFKGIFAPGQAYVALSRVTSSNGLYITDY